MGQQIKDIEVQNMHLKSKISFEVQKLTFGGCFETYYWTSMPIFLVKKSIYGPQNWVGMISKKTRAEKCCILACFARRDLSYETDSGPKTKTVSRAHLWQSYSNLHSCTLIVSKKQTCSHHEVPCKIHLTHSSCRLLGIPIGPWSASK